MGGKRGRERRKGLCLLVLSILAMGLGMHCYLTLFSLQLLLPSKDDYAHLTFLSLVVFNCVIFVFVFVVFIWAPAGGVSLKDNRMTSK